MAPKKKPRVEPSPEYPRCTQCNGYRIPRGQQGSGTCTFIGCPDPLHDNRKERGVEPSVSEPARCPYDEQQCEYPRCLVVDPNCHGRPVIAPQSTPHCPNTQCDGGEICPKCGGCVVKHCQCAPQPTPEPPDDKWAREAAEQEDGANVCTGAPHGVGKLPAKWTDDDLYDAYLRGCEDDGVLLSKETLLASWEDCTDVE